MKRKNRKRRKSE